jgi:hypothetical protein
MKRGGGKCFKLPGPDYFACVFVFNDLSILQINGFRTRPVDCASESQCFLFGVKVCPSDP